MPIARFSQLNWRRGFAEVALIFVGITLALLFDNANEARKDRLLERQLFEALRADLLETRADLVTDIETAEARAVNTKALIEALASDDPPENAGRELLWREIGTSRLFQKNFAYRALVAQGADSITHWPLLKAATDLYELQFSRVVFVENSAFAAERRVLDRLYPHMDVPEEILATLPAELESGPFLRTAPMEIVDWQALRADRELLHWLMESFESTRAAVVFYRRALSHLDRTVDMIDREFGPPTEPAGHEQGS